MKEQKLTKRLDVSYCRSHFPALSSGYTYFDNAGGSQTLKQVVDRITDYLYTTNVQHGASYEKSKQASKRLEDASMAMKTFVNANDHQEIVMSSSATMLLKILALTFGATLEPGDEIIVTDTDHEANLSPWTDLQKQGIIIKVWKVNTETLLLDISELERLITCNTKLVAICHVSNVLGTINPIKEITQVVHKNGALICVDGVAFTPHRALDVQDLDVDFYVFSSYKVFGPHHGVLYGKKELLLNLPGINHYFIPQDSLPYKLQPGGANYELSYGMIGVVDYFNDICQHHELQVTDDRSSIVSAFDLFSSYEEQITERLLNYLRSKDNVLIIGEQEADKTIRVGIVSFIVEGRDSNEIVLEVDKHNIGIRFGDFYAKKIISALGLEKNNGLVRVSMAHYNTIKEVDQLITVLDIII